MRAEEVKRLARDCGFELVGVERAEPAPEAAYYQEWVRAGMSAEMSYLTGRRADLRNDPRNLLPSARSIICVGKLYNGPRGPISRYACGPDYHGVLREALRRLGARLKERAGPFEWRIAVDTAPLLERAYARRAGLGWIGKNTCLIHQGMGSFFFLGELLVSLELEPDAPPPDRCGTCTRCIDACPTRALVPTGKAQPAWALDSRRCISCLTVELRGPIPEHLRSSLGNHVFGCDICQDVCPWNREVPPTSLPAPTLQQLAALTEHEFHEMFRGTPVLRAGYDGFQRNVALALSNRGADDRPASSAA
ncbi:MAG: tRNA epoxyqueuosine(34) reductase QueG [Bryobacteraceae bacterium]|jgi:epoxyqueuosine reductase